MVLQSINEYQAVFRLTMQDMREKGIDIHDPNPPSEVFEPLFLEALEITIQNKDDWCVDGPLLMDMRRTGPDELHLVLTNVAAQMMSIESELLSSLSDDIEPDSCNYVVGVFSTLDDVITVCTRLANFKIHGLKSELYKQDDKYYLCVSRPDDIELFDGLSLLTSVVSEYTQCLNISSLYVAHLEEHGECIIKFDALGKLANL